MGPPNVYRLCRVHNRKNCKFNFVLGTTSVLPGLSITEDVPFLAERTWILGCGMAISEHQLFTPGTSVGQGF